MTRIIPARGARGLWPWETLEQYMQEVDTFLDPSAPNPRQRRRLVRKSDIAGAS